MAVVYLKVLGISFPQTVRARVQHGRSESEVFKAGLSWNDQSRNPDESYAMT
jgi:hypothetical protein